LFYCTQAHTEKFQFFTLNREKRRGEERRGEKRRERRENDTRGEERRGGVKDKK
jgi:hypothetical protein